MSKSILFLVPYPHAKAPSQRFRFEQYLNLLHEKGFTLTLKSFLDNDTMEVLYKSGNTFNKFRGIFLGFLRRLAILFSVSKYDFVFIHREAAPIGPPVFEWVISKILRKKIIYDFDDAIWIPNTSAENKIAASFKWHQKVASICKWSYKVSCGNNYLCNYALQYNANVVYNPTTIDTLHYHYKIKDQDTTEIVIGWTGTHSTTKYLDLIVPVIARLESELSFRFMVIADKDPKLPLKSYVFNQWRKESEIEDLLNFNVGIMPLTEDPWAKGKCGFKALQYMALGIPAAVSPVGVNVEIVDEMENGFLCSTDEEWYHKLKTLIINSELRGKMGAKARSKVEQLYSVEANKNNFLSLFQ